MSEVMSKSDIPTDRLLPLEQLTIPPMVAELNGYAAMAERYSKIIPAALPGLPDIPPMIIKFLKRLLEELLERIRPRLIELIVLAMSYAASKIIPVVNEIVWYVNKLIVGLNQMFAECMKVLRPIFQVLAISGLIWGITKILLSVIPDAGFGMGAVFIPTTVPKRIMNFLNGLAESCYKWLKKPCGIILNWLRRLCKWLAYINYLQALLNMLKLFEAFLKSDAAGAVTSSADDWDASVGNEAPVDSGLLVECTLPEGSVPNPEMLTPEVCIARGGTFEGMDLLAQLNDLNYQINLAMQNTVTGGVCQSGPECENLTYEECIANNPPCEWVEDPIVQCLLPSGEIEEMTLSECLAAGGQPLSAAELAALLLERTALLDQLQQLGLDGIMFDSDLVTTLLNLNDTVDQQSVTENTGINYGWYGFQEGDTQTPPPDDEDDTGG